jgi:hypothetical protein
MAFDRPAWRPYLGNPFPQPEPDLIKKSAMTAVRRKYPQSDSGAPVKGGPPQDEMVIRAYPTIRPKKKIKTYFVDPRNPGLWLNRQKRDMVTKGITPRDKGYSS